jgi:ABC-type glycerol-3-phosphate transport system permease component
MAISGIFGRGGQTWSFLAALAILMSVPVVVIFLILQRQLLDRMLFGPVGE